MAITPSSANPKTTGAGIPPIQSFTSAVGSKKRERVRAEARAARWESVAGAAPPDSDRTSVAAKRWPLAGTIVAREKPSVPDPPVVAVPLAGADPVESGEADDPDGAGVTPTSEGTWPFCAATSVAAARV